MELASGAELFHTSHAPAATPTMPSELTAKMGGARFSVPDSRPATMPAMPPTM